MARIAGVDLPPKKRAEIGLTYIYGIGRTRAKSLLHRTNVDPNKKIGDLSEDRSQPHPPDPRGRGRGGRRSPQGSVAQHQAAHRNAVLSGLSPSPARSARPAVSVRTRTRAPVRVPVPRAAPWPTRRKRASKTLAKAPAKATKKKAFKKKEKRVVHIERRACSGERLTTPSSPSRIPKGQHRVVVEREVALGFRSSRKGIRRSPLSEAALTAANKANEVGLRTVEVRVSGPGSGRS